MRFLPAFRLEIRTSRDEEFTTIRVEVANISTPRQEAARALASAFGRPGEFVHLDEARGTFTIGAGLWSRRGFYRLTPDGNAALTPARS